MNTNKPHVHAALIKAWADGAEIQYRDVFGDWVDIKEPNWVVFKDYRVKPEPVYTAYYKRAVFREHRRHVSPNQFYTNAVHEVFFTTVERDPLFIRWIDTEPQRELVSE